jgi:hypothetical protein
MNNPEAVKKLEDLQDQARRLHDTVYRLAEMMEDVPALAKVRGSALQMLQELEKKTRLIPEIAPGAHLSSQQERDVAEVAKSYTEMEQGAAFMLRLLGDPRA